MTSADHRPLVPPAVRRSAVVLVSLCALLLVALAVGYHGRDGYTGIDGAIVRALPFPGSSRQLLNDIADVVPPVLTGAVIVLVVLGAVQRDARLAALAAIGPTLSMLVTEGGKRVVGRTIDGELAMPSGHTAGVTSVSLVVVVLLLRATHRQTRAACIAALGVVTLATLVIGAVMVLLRAHYPTDIAAGWAAALVCTLGSALAIDRVAEGRRLGALAPR